MSPNAFEKPYDILTVETGPLTHLLKAVLVNPEQPTELVDVGARLEAIEDKMTGLAVALDALITAMKAGAIGKWTP